MLTVFSPIFVADTKTIFGYNFRVPLRLVFQNLEGHKIEKFVFGEYFPKKYFRIQERDVF